MPDEYVVSYPRGLETKARRSGRQAAEGSQRFEAGDELH